MSKKARKVHLLGVGVLLPAMIGHQHAAAATSRDPVVAVQYDASLAADQSIYNAKKAELARSIQELSIAEKLERRGDRIQGSPGDMLVPRAGIHPLRFAGTTDACCTRKRFHPIRRFHHGHPAPRRRRHGHR